MGVLAFPGSNTEESTAGGRPEVGKLQTVRVLGGKQVPSSVFFPKCLTVWLSHCFLQHLSLLVTTA